MQSRALKVRRALSLSRLRPAGKRGPHAIRAWRNVIRIELRRKKFQADLIDQSP